MCLQCPLCCFLFRIYCISPLVFSRIIYVDNLGGNAFNILNIKNWTCLFNLLDRWILIRKVKKRIDACGANLMSLYGLWECG